MTRLTRRRARATLASEMILTMPWGGKREGAGRRSVFPEKDLSRRFYMDFTPEGRKLLVKLQKRSRLSRNDVLSHLVEQYAAGLTFDPAQPNPFPGKLGRRGTDNLGTNVMTLVFQPHVGDLLVATHERTGQGYSNIGEALVRWYGPDAEFPKLPPKPRKRRRVVRKRGKA